MTVDVRSTTYPLDAETVFTPVRISPSQLKIDNRFPVLGFTIDTGGRAYFEVLLTTDRSLFDGANAGRRTSANFFASREHGLVRGGSEPVVYHVPSAVLQAFAGAREIFYTAIAYDSDRLINPVYAQPPDSLVRQAPSILLSSDFNGRTMSSILSVPIEKLLRVRDDAVATGTSPLMSRSVETQGTSYSMETDAAADRCDGEDGFGQTAAVAYDDGFGALPGAQSAGNATEASATNTSDDYDDGFGGSPPQPPPTGAPPAEGYRDEAEWAGEKYAAAQESVFPAGAAAPAMLEDEDEEERYPDQDTDKVPEYQALDGPPQELTPQEQIRILQLIGNEFESGSDRYSAINADGEFRGVFPNHPAINQWHVGLSWGFVQFTQDSGGIGEVLRAMRQRDAARFNEIFGADADALLSVTTAAGPSSRTNPPRGPRVQPVGGHDLWEEPWLSRFRTAGAHPPFQAAQNEVAARIYIQPIRAFARQLGLDSQRALTMVVDRSIQMGPGGARHWILDAVSPIATDAQRNSALRTLGHPDLRSFQRAAGVSADGQWGPETHAAMIAALRALPAGRSPVPIPTREQMLDAMVRQSAAQHRPWAHRPASLRTSSAVSDDITYAL